MRHYWGTSPIGSRRTKPPINTPDAGVTGAEGSGGHGRASRSTTPRLPPRVWRSRGRPGPTVPRKPAAPQAPPRRSDGGRAERRPKQRGGHCTRYGALHPLWAAAPVMGRCTRYGALHPLWTATPVTGHCTRYEPLHPLWAAAPVMGCDTRYGALHPLRAAAPDQKGCTAYGSGAAHPITRKNAESARRRPTQQREGAPVMGRCTRSEGVHCLRIGCSAPNHKNKRGIREMTAGTHKTRPPELAQFDEVLRRRECDTHKAPGARYV